MVSFGIYFLFFYLFFFFFLGGGVLYNRLFTVKVGHLKCKTVMPVKCYLWPWY